MADRRAFTTCQHRGPGTRHPRRWRRAKQEHATVQPLHGARLDAMPDSALADPRLEQLHERDHVVLPTGNPGDFAAHSAHLLVTRRPAACA